MSQLQGDYLHYFELIDYNSGQAITKGHLVAKASLSEGKLHLRKCYEGRTLTDSYRPQRLGG